jgi:hypothetical protein
MGKRRECCRRGGGKYYEIEGASKVAQKILHFYRGQDPFGRNMAPRTAQEKRSGSGIADKALG